MLQFGNVPFIICGNFRRLFVWSWLIGVLCAYRKMSCWAGHWVGLVITSVNCYSELTLPCCLKPRIKLGTKTTLTYMASASHCRLSFFSFRRMDSRQQFLCWLAQKTEMADHGLDTSAEGCNETLRSCWSVVFYSRLWCPANSAEVLSLQTLQSGPKVWTSKSTSNY